MQGDELHACRLRCTAPLGRSLCLRRASSQRKTQGRASHALPWIACLTERSIRLSWHLAYAARLGHSAKRIAHKVYVTSFWCCRDVSHRFKCWQVREQQGKLSFRFSIGSPPERDYRWFALVPKCKQGASSQCRDDRGHEGYAPWRPRCRRFSRKASRARERPSQQKK